MTENSGNPAGTGGQTPDYGAPPVPPAAAETPPAGSADYPPPAAPGYQQPPAGYQAPPAADYQVPPTAGYQPPASAQPPAGGVGQQFSNFDPKTLQNFDPKTVNPLDWGIIAAGVLAFIFSTFGFYKYSVSVAGFSNSATVSAWHGFFGWFGVLVALVASIVLAVQLIAKIQLPFSVRTVVLGGYALATLCLLLALFIVPGNTGGAGGVFGVKIDKGHGFGYWITFLVVIAGTGLSAKRFTDGGGKLPSRG